MVFDHGGDVVWVAADGSVLRRFVAIGPMTSGDVSPDGRQIVYSTCVEPRERRVHSEQYELVRASIEDAGSQRLTRSGHYENYPAWSPDGTRIAYLSTLESVERLSYIDRSRLSPWLHTLPADSTEVQPHAMQSVVSGIQPDLPPQLVGIGFHSPQWAPDGERIAFVGQESTRTAAIYTVGPDGADLRRLATTVSGPSWSPEGERLAFAKPDGNEVSLYTIAADGSDAQRLLTLPVEYWHLESGEPDPARAWIETLAWSPVGNHLLFTCGRDICVVDLDGTHVGRSPRMPLYAHPRTPPVAAWAPDGSRIAISSPDLLDHRGVVLYTMAPDGSNARILAVRAAGMDPRPIGPRRRASPMEVAACTAGASVSDPSSNPGLVRDCKTLLGFRDTLKASPTLAWNSEHPVTEWEGVVVSGSPPRVTELVLDGRGLWGTIPSKLGELAQLQVLDLSWNNLGGDIPPELGKLTHLRRLDVSGNFLGGHVPAELGALAGLVELRFGWNYLDGSIPGELSALANLTILDASLNLLAGPIPATMGQVTTLESLLVASNQLSGAIPPELGELVRLKELHLGGNQLSGAIPPELGQLARLESLRLGVSMLTSRANRLTGCIPLALLEVQDNDLSSLELPECNPG